MEPDRGSDPVEGGGSYLASAKAPEQTDVKLAVRVAGSGPMAPMWEAIGRPLLPQFARAFANQLKTEIEQAMGRLFAVPIDAGSSMYFDRLAGRPLEIDAITGAVVAAGERHGIATPLNRMLLTLARAAREVRIEE